MEKNDLAMIKAENDRLMNDIEKLKQRLREEITRTQAGVRLDLNLEKGRMREESSGQELKIKEVDTRIEQEIAGLRTAIQSSKVNDCHNCRLCTITDDISSLLPGDDTAISRWFRFVCKTSRVDIDANTFALFSYRLFRPLDGVHEISFIIYQPLQQQSTKSVDHTTS